jgi:hypothetical protein
MRDPYWTTARFDGRDADGNTVRKGDRIFYYPATRSVLTGAKAEQAARDSSAAVDDERMFGGGL